MRVRVAKTINDQQLTNFMQEVFKILPQMLKSEGKEEVEQLDEAIVFAAWRRVAGEQLRDQAVPFRVYNKRLIIAVADETWKRHLEDLSPQLLFKLSGALGRAAIAFLEFRIDTRTIDCERERLFRERTSQIERERVAMQNVPENVRRAANKIEDDNLRRNFLLAAGSCLARRRKR